MTNGTLQINFFNDHTKLIVCPLMSAATYIDQSRQFRTFKFSGMEKYGCSKDVYTRLRYARTMVERLLTQSSSSKPGALSTVVARSSATVSTSNVLQPPASAHRLQPAPLQ
uniref:Polo kinase n=1 Tax=Plectus sambesii TaxID=2011161 RepID=A0A914XNW4_9BILA